MKTVTVDTLAFTFSEDWKVSKYDDWSFYRNKFQSIGKGRKAVDLLAIDPQNTTWMIEVKNYQVHSRTKPSCLADEIMWKVMDILSGLLPASINSEEDSEKIFAKQINRSGCLRIVLHLEQPQKHSKLFPIAIKPADVQQKLRMLVKAIDAHPRVCDKTTSNALGWNVT